jgi:hypothetical protein
MEIVKSNVLYYSLYNDIFEIMRTENKETGKRSWWRLVHICDEEKPIKQLRTNEKFEPSEMKNLERISLYEWDCFTLWGRSYPYATSKRRDTEQEIEHWTGWACPLHADTTKTIPPTSLSRNSDGCWY